MVILLVHIFNNKNILVSDGWYVVCLSVDSELSNLIENKKLVIGMKLSIAGLISSEPQSDPLEIDISLPRFQLSYNSCLVAPSDSKLGYTRDRAIIRSLDSIVNEGLISGVRVCIKRIYPRKYIMKEQDKE